MNTLFSSDSHVNILQQEIKWLEYCIVLRLSDEDSDLPEAPQIDPKKSYYGNFLIDNKLNKEERFILVLSMAVYLRPNLFHLFLADKEIYKKSSLHKSSHDIGLLPTIETALYLLTGENLEKRLLYLSYFDSNHLFYKKSLLDFSQSNSEEPDTFRILRLSFQWQEYFLHNRIAKPRFSEQFPAIPIQTDLEWEDLILMPATRKKLDEARAYLEFSETISSQWGMAKHARPGCRILFHGDPGTGKTLAASLLGKVLNQHVFRVDISAVTSKYVGETSKRLNSLFNTAEDKNWIIFFDEGDALFGQRQDQTSSNSHYANQDVSFLLQRIESYNGIIIVATNLKNNIDVAFTRRFQSIVKFQQPDASLQLEFWLKNLPEPCRLSPEIKLEAVVQRYSLTPASIIAVILRCCTHLLQHGTEQITSEVLEVFLKDEDFKYKGRA